MSQTGHAGCGSFGSSLKYWVQAEGTTFRRSICPKLNFDALRELEDLEESQEGKHWRKLEELNASTLKGWTFYETSNATRYSLLCPFVRENRKTHLTCVNAALVISKSLTQFYDGKAAYVMDLMEADIYLRPQFLQLCVRDSKKKYTFVFDSTMDYAFLVKSIKCQIEAKERRKEMWLEQRIQSLHRSCAMVVRETRQFCDESLYGLIRDDLQSKHLVESTTRQGVWRLCTLARGWWSPLCLLIPITSRYVKIKR